MKSLLVLCFLFFAFTVNVHKLSAQKIVSQTDNAKGKTYAVIVGITNYENTDIPALQFADKDAQQFSAFLQSKGGGHIPVDHIKLLTNKEATIAAVYDALDWLKEVCGNNDVAYIYFSGHGDVETKNDSTKGYLLAYNSPPNNYANNAIRVEDINKLSISLTTINGAKVILISDACHSGKLAGDFYKGKQLTAEQLNKVLDDQVRLASCATDEEAAEGSDWGGGRGVFSYYLIMGLQGLADLRQDSIIQLRDLAKYLDSSFAADKYLIQNKHIQNPVTDGNPNYPVAITDSATLNSLLATIKKNKSGGSDLPPGLMKLKPMKAQPIDYFFTTTSSLPIESILDFDSYITLDGSALPLKMVNDCIAYQNNLLEEMASATYDERLKKNYNIFNLDSLNLLKNQLSDNQLINNRFIEKFIQSVHQKGQDMINAYIKGDMEELERRQYYYSGKRDYKKYLSMLHIALKLVPENYSLARILTIHNFYMTGLIDRMLMETNANTDSLLSLAFYNQQQALKMEPYAAYISNELGNLYLFKKNYDSAKYNFHLATVLSPTWAIPWSNMIRLNMVLSKFDEAEKDIRTADSLQSNLAFVFINAGMMMEKRKNLLAAESYYLRAIKINNVHFLPFEKLGYIYLNTGEYQKSNYYLYQAQTRKKDFSINDIAFEDGPMMNSLPDRTEPWPPPGECPGKLVARNNITRQYIDLLNGLSNLDSSGAGYNLLQKVVSQNQHIPLANHFLGENYYKSGKLELAKKTLELSISNFLDADELMKRLTKDIFGRPLSKEDSCQVNPFLKYQYDELEDRYLLANIYEKLGENPKAFSQYESISSIENARLLEQATYKNVPSLVKNYKGLPEKLDEYLNNENEKIIPMAGSIKAARLYEKTGDYEQAEKVLLKQISFSRAAGNARHKANNDRNPEMKDYDNYWLNANSYLESEIYNFYKKVLNLFPRNPVWQEKAGLFLYNRLESAFSQVPIGQRERFYQSIEGYPYPWKGDGWVDDNYFVLPGTGDTLIITKTRFDPVKEALNALNLSVQLSGDIQPHINAAKALADINSWLGNEDQSIYWFKQSVLLKPADSAQRNKFMDYLQLKDRLTDACIQLDTLYKQKNIRRNQTIQLADWKWLSGEKRDTKAIMDKFKPVNEEEKRSVLLLKSKMSMLSGDTKSALQFLLDSSTISPDNKMQNNNRLFSIARLYALLHKDETAFSFLKLAIDSAFNEEYVIYYDKALNALRGSEKWNNIIKNPPIPLVEEPIKFIKPEFYSTPQGLQ